MHLQLIVKVIILLLFILNTYAQEIIDEQDQINNEEYEEIQLEQQKYSQYGPFIGAFLANVFSEFGDRTFIIAAILSTKYNIYSVFFGSLLAAVLMTLLTCLFGHTINLFIPSLYIKIFTSFLFFYFAIKLYYAGFKEKSNNDSDDNSSSDDEKQVKKDLKKFEEKVESDKQKKKQLLKQQFSILVFTEAFTQNFLGEWGDRSQITQITLAASQNIFLIFFGSILGQLLCIIIAVIGGGQLSQKINSTILNFGGALIMMLFAIDGILSLL